MAITVQDCIVVAPADTGRLEALLRASYLPQAAERGLQLQGMHYSPPVLTANSPVTLWLRWAVADPQAWWAMRARAGCASVLAFWREVDTFCLRRERVYLTADAAPTLPAANGAPAPAGGIRGYRETAQLALRNPEDDSLEQRLASAVAGVAGLERAVLGRNLAPEYAAGHYTWDLHFVDRAAADALLQGKQWAKQVAPLLERHCSAVHAFGLEHIDGGVRAPALQQGVKRTAFFRLLPAIEADTAARFERDLLEMPLHLPQILNWRLSRARPAAWSRSDLAPWTYVWEQDFADLEGLTGPYMLHPHHWSHIDRWFDPESGEQIVDTGISHAFNLFTTAVLGAELVPA